jgi:hypothetical protein
VLRHPARAAVVANLKSQRPLSHRASHEPLDLGRSGAADIIAASFILIVLLHCVCTLWRDWCRQRGPAPRGTPRCDTGCTRRRELGAARSDARNSAAATACRGSGSACEASTSPRGRGIVVLGEVDGGHGVIDAA